MTERKYDEVEAHREILAMRRRLVIEGIETRRAMLERGWPEQYRTIPRNTLLTEGKE